MKSRTIVRLFCFIGVKIDFFDQSVFGINHLKTLARLARGINN